MNRTVYTAVLMLMLGALALHAQPGTGDGSGTTGGNLKSDRIAIDGIAAIVDDNIILISDVAQRVTLFKGQSPSIQISDQDLYREVLNDLIVNNLLLVQAEKDSIVVSDDMIDAQLDERVNQLVSQVGGSASVLEQAYGKSMQEIRAEARPIIREQLMVELLRRDKFADLKVTERDMDEFYRQYRDSLPEVPEQIEIAHILLLVKPSDDAREKTIALGNAIIDSLKAGGDFAEFAKRYSVDPGSGARGGELGWVPRGRFVKEYEDAAWALELNEISEPTESQFGVHIIQLLDKKEDEIRSRHILLPLKADEQQKKQMIDSLASIRSRIMAGESFARMASTYSDDEESKYNGGVLAKYPVSELPADFQWIVDSMEVGQVSEPRPIDLSPTESGYHIIKLNRIIPAHKVNLEEDRKQIERLATSWKQNQKMLEWVTELRKSIYWEIKYKFE